MNVIDRTVYAAELGYTDIHIVSTRAGEHGSWYEYENDILVCRISGIPHKVDVRWESNPYKDPGWVYKVRNVQKITDDEYAQLLRTP